MPMVPLRNIGAGGLVPDQQPYDVELTQFPAGNNVQMFNGRLGKALGYVDVATVANAPTHVAGWAVDSNNSVVIGTTNNLYRFNGSTVADVTAAAYTSGYANSPRWQSAQIGTGFLANNGSDKPQYMTATGTAFADLANRWPNATYRRDDAAIAPIAARVFDPSRWNPDQPIRVFLIGTDFEVQVWETLLKIPVGRATTYQSVARHIGRPSAPRAGGAAVGKNPISFVVPCHRVVGSTGALTGYHWGLPRKRAILGWECGVAG